MKFIKRFIVKAMMRRRLRKNMKYIYHWMIFIFEFTRKYKEQGYDLQWICRQLYKCDRFKNATPELLNVLSIAISYGYYEDISLKEFNKLIWEDMSIVNKKMLDKITWE